MREVEDGAVNAADEDGEGGVKKSSCICSPVSAPLRGRPIWDYVRRARDGVIPLIERPRNSSCEGCPRPLLA
jgi:hypothetical protein